MAEYYQSLVCKNNKLIGEEIARLEVIVIKLFIMQICTLNIYNGTFIFLACRGIVQSCTAEIKQAEFVPRLRQQGAEKSDGGEKR